MNLLYNNYVLCINFYLFFFTYKRSYDFTSFRNTALYIYIFQ